MVVVWRRDEVDNLINLISVLRTGASRQRGTVRGLGSVILELRVNIIVDWETTSSNYLDFMLGGALPLLSILELQNCLGQSLIILSFCRYRQSLGTPRANPRSPPLNRHADDALKMLDCHT
jgi:hypothetical protein